MAINNRITKAEIFTALFEMARQNDMDISKYDSRITNDMVMNLCANEIVQIKQKSAKQKERNETKPKEVDPLRMPIIAALSETDWKTAYQVLSELNIPEGEDISMGKVSYRLSAMASENICEKDKTYITDEEGKRKQLTVYRLLPQDQVSEI